MPSTPISVVNVNGIDRNARQRGTCWDAGVISADVTPTPLPSPHAPNVWGCFLWNWELELCLTGKPAAWNVLILEGWATAVHDRNESSCSSAYVMYLNYNGHRAVANVPQQFMRSQKNPLRWREAWFCTFLVRKLDIFILSCSYLHGVIFTT